MSRVEITKALALDCEMVMAEDGSNLLAQVALCNEHGKGVYNSYVKQSNVKDYKTSITGIGPNHLQGGKQYQVVRTEVAHLLQGRILVGHALHNDLKALDLTHPESMKRDTALFFRNENGTFPSLKDLAQKHLGWTIQEGRHKATKDARAAMRIYKKYESTTCGWNKSSA